MDRFKSISILINGIEVVLTQIEDKNSSSYEVYKLTANGFRGWCYGRGDSQCINSLNGDLEIFRKMAHNYIFSQL